MKQKEKADKKGSDESGGDEEEDASEISEGDGFSDFDESLSVDSEGFF